MPGSEVAGVVRARRTARRSSAGDRVAAFCMLGGFAEVALAQPHFTFPLPGRARLRAGRRADPQLPHGLLRAGDARAPGRGRDRARPRRRGRRRDGVAAGRQGPRRAHDRGRLQRREGAGRARGGRRRGAALRRRRGRTRPRRSAAPTSCSTRSAATASPTACARCKPDGRLRGRRLHRRLDPRGARQPPAAQQHRGRRRRLGRLHRPAAGGDRARSPPRSTR